MVLKRKIYNELLDWKNESNGATALLVKGARRVGKSYICRKFGEAEYGSMVFIDFSNADNTLKDFFYKDTYNLDIFFAKISAYHDVPLRERNTLFVFDEVQSFPRARQLIKHLVADGRYDYIETGSLLSIKQNVKDILIPSEEDDIEMHPMDFEEFLWAIGADTTPQLLQSCFEQKMPLGQALHRKVMNDFRQYILVGGMPQSLLAYINDKDFAAADKAKRRILSLYRKDIARFAQGYESKVSAIFDTIPGQLSKKEKKYRITSLGKNARLREYEDAFMWLADGMITNPCFNATDPNAGLSLSLDHRTHKLYMADTGLLVTHAFADKSFSDNDLYKAILLDRLSINEGMIMENVVAQMLRSSGHRLFFYSRSDSDNHSSRMEIDFLIRGDKKICPIEVKSSNYRKHSSLDKFRQKFKHALGDAYILYGKDLMIKEGIIHLPLYMAMFL
ncbi:MAG: AAA family ATPase [Oscillospiraceae bacterium]|nr:AAA family ATPase [Oscillospiraceae bacterium]